MTFVIKDENGFYFAGLGPGAKDVHLVCKFTKYKSKARTYLERDRANTAAKYIGFRERKKMNVIE